MTKTMADQAREQADKVDAGEAVNVKGDSYGCGYSEWDLLKDELIQRGYAQTDVRVTKGQWFWTVRQPEVHRPGGPRRHERLHPRAPGRGRLGPDG